MNIFYVYAHIRNDSNTVFYIGKGKERRAFVKRSRSTYWKRIVQKAGYTVKLLAENLSESEALELEILIISEYRRFGVNLCNLTDGGEGSSGYKHSFESIEKIKIIQKNRKPMSLETKQKISLIHKGKPKNRTEEHTKKLNASRKGRTPHNKGKKFSDETRAKLSASMKGRVAWNKGIKATQESKEKQSLKMLSNARKWTVENTYKRNLGIIKKGISKLDNNGIIILLYLITSNICLKKE